MTINSLIIWIIVGAITGIVVDAIAGGLRMGLVGAIVTGVLGAILSGWLFNTFLSGWPCQSCLFLAYSKNKIYLRGNSNPEIQIMLNLIPTTSQINCLSYLYLLLGDPIAKVVFSSEYYLIRVRFHGVDPFNACDLPVAHK